MNTKTSLLRMEEVQKELGLEGEVLEKVNAFVEETSNDMREKFQELRDEGLEPDEMRAEMEKMQASAQEKEQVALAELLNEEQTKRLNQLLAQRIGGAAVIREDVAKAIDLSDDQLAKLKEKFAELDQKRNEAFREAMENQDREAFRSITEEYQKGVQAAVDETLSDEQKTAFEEYKGEKFAFPERQRGGGGGRSRNDF